MKNFKKLKIWQKGMEIVMQTYRLANQLPDVEKFGLRLQITKASISIPSNIAEGSAKSSKREYRKYLEIFLGSAFELETQVLSIEMLELGGDKNLINALLKDVDEEQKMLVGFIKTVSHD
jgi:four helix bundle protein